MPHLRINKDAVEPNLRKLSGNQAPDSLPTESHRKADYKVPNDVRNDVDQLKRSRLMSALEKRGRCRPENLHNKQR